MPLSCGLFVDTSKLRLREGDVQQEIRTAQLLYEKLLLAQQCSDQSEDVRYKALIEDAARLVGFCREMCDNLDRFASEFELLSHRIHNILENSKNEAIHHFQAIDIIADEY